MKTTTNKSKISRDSITDAQASKFIAIQKPSFRIGIMYRALLRAERSAVNKAERALKVGTTKAEGKKAQKVAEKLAARITPPKSNVVAAAKVGKGSKKFQDAQKRAKAARLAKMAPAKEIEAPVNDKVIKLSEGVKGQDVKNMKRHGSKAAMKV